MNCKDMRDLVEKMNDDRASHTAEAQRALSQCANTVQQLQNLERVWRERHQLNNNFVQGADSDWELAADELAAVIVNWNPK